MTWLIGGGVMGGTYQANAVNFDGTNDYLTRGSDLTGSADGKEITLSFWYKPTALGATRAVLTNTDNRVYFAVNSSGAFVFSAYNSSNDVILSAGTNTDPITAGNWHHIIVSVDLSNSSNRHVYVDDLPITTNYGVYIDDDMNFTESDWSFGAPDGGGGSGSGGIRIYGDVSDVWFDDTYIDISVEASRRKFISPSGRPVNLGDNGSTPTGSSPLITLKNPTDTWHTNVGTGGGFTENGTLTTATSSPSD